VSAASPGRIVLADTSAWHRSVHPAVRAGWLEALEDGRIVTCSVVRLELLYSARDADGLARLDAALAALRELPVSASVQRAAAGAMRALAERGPLHHRVPIADLLIAAAAQQAAVGVLHYDRHYDRLAEVLEFESRWIAPAGSL
jgi:predicted nucleic acid-binding protein